MPGAECHIHSTLVCSFVGALVKHRSGLFLFASCVIPQIIFGYVLVHSIAMHACAVFAFLVGSEVIGCGCDAMQCVWEGVELFINIIILYFSRYIIRNN
jgi:hypothetical protein